MTLTLTIALLATLAWLAFAGYQFYQLVEMRGTWYNELRMDDDRENNFRNRLRITVKDRLDVPTTLALFVGSTLAVFFLTWVVATGTATLVTAGCGVV